MADVGVGVAALIQLAASAAPLRWKLTTGGVTLRIMVQKKVNKRVKFTEIQGAIIVTVRGKDSEMARLRCLGYKEKRVNCWTEKAMEHVTKARTDVILVSR